MLPVPDHGGVKKALPLPSRVCRALGVTVAHVRCWRQGARLGVTFFSSCK